MNLDINLLANNSVILVPIIVAIVQAIKLTGWVKDHFAPLVSILVGIILGFLIGDGLTDLSNTILSGAIYGLTASGLYSGVKTTMIARMRQRDKMYSQPYNKK